MRQKIFPFFLVAFYFLVSPQLVIAQINLDTDPAPTLDQLTGLFGRVISIVAIVGGFLSFIALIVGGFKYITARGDPKAITAAQGSITWAIIGLALIIISWLILKVVADFTGLQQLLKFCIGTTCFKL